MSTPSASVNTGVTTTPPPNPVSEPRNPASAETANTIPENTRTFIVALPAPRKLCPSLLRFPLQARAVQNLQLMALDAHQIFGAEAGQGPRRRFPHRTQP